MVVAVVRTSRAIERETLDPKVHFALIDADLDEYERTAVDRHTTLVTKLDALQSTQTWLLRTVGAGFVSFIVLAAAALVLHR